MDSRDGRSPVERLAEEGNPPPWVRHEHETRYRWASTLVEDKRVIDVACGAGYGVPWLLDGGATSVDGFDMDAAAIEEARARCGDRARFEVADGTALPVADDTYDMYLSFETIEHIDDDRAYVAEAARVLKPGGWLVCSTPNRNVTNPGTSITDTPYNPHHVREYTRPELGELLGEHFGVGFIGQTPRQTWYLWLLRTIGRRSPMAAVRTHQARKVLGLPFESAARHKPTLWPIHGESEVIIAMCKLR